MQKKGKYLLKSEIYVPFIFYNKLVKIDMLAEIERIQGTTIMYGKMVYHDVVYRSWYFDDFQTCLPHLHLSAVHSLINNVMLENSATSPSVVPSDRSSPLDNSMFLAQTTYPFLLFGDPWSQEEPQSLSNDVTTDAINDVSLFVGGNVQNQDESTILSRFCTNQDFSDALSIWIEDTGCMASYIQICEMKIDQFDRFW